jgi:hypothetical protein
MFQIIDERTPNEIADELCEKIKKTSTHLFVGESRLMSPDVTQATFERPYGGNDLLDEELEEQRLTNIRKEIKRFVSEDELQILSESRTDFARVEKLIRQKDQSNPRAEIIQAMPEIFMRYRVSKNCFDYPIKPAYDTKTFAKKQTEAKLLARLYRLPYEKYCGQFFKMIENVEYGGSPEIIWYGKPQEIFAHLRTGHNKEHWMLSGTISFHNPTIIVLNTENGTGYDMKLPDTTITLPFDAKCLVADDATNQSWGWNRSCGLVEEYYRTELSFAKNAKP